jgi:hypothetical protein
VSLIPNGFRRSIKTTEFYGTIAAIIFIFLICRPLDVFLKAVCFAFIVSSFNVSRAMYKKNRGIYSSAMLSGEFLLTMLCNVFIVLCVLFYGIDRLKAAGLIAVTQAIYNIGRGVAKGVGVKTQTIMR